MQRLLGSAVVDADGLRDDLRSYVVAHLGDPAAVLVVDETGDVKKGTMTVAVQRQYTGTAGRIENAQVAVYLVYAAERGYAFIDRALYLPRSWADDPGRCQEAGVPGEVRFATKPALALAMITRAVAAGVPARWAAGDEVYGNDPKLRKGIAGHGLGFVLAVAKDHQIRTAAGPRRAIDLAVCLPPRAWQQMSAGDGAKGPRLYGWAFIETTDPALPETARARTGCWSADLPAHPPARRLSTRSTARTHPDRCRCTRWSAWPGPGGRSRRASPAARSSPPWTSTRSGPGPPGRGGRSWRCSPTRSCRS